jgi:hypothetical protein
MSAAGVEQRAASTKSISWQDPTALAAAGAEISGREFLEAIVDGRLPPPPIVRLIGAELVSVGEGEAHFTPALPPVKPGRSPEHRHGAMQRHAHGRYRPRFDPSVCETPAACPDDSTSTRTFVQ